jgi:hypothetical protein
VGRKKFYSYVSFVREKRENLDVRDNNFKRIWIKNTGIKSVWNSYSFNPDPAFYEKIYVAKTSFC